MKDYCEHALTAGSGASAVAYVEAEGPDGTTWWGVGMDSSILDASLHAVVSAATRARESSPSPATRVQPDAAAGSAPVDRLRGLIPAPARRRWRSWAHRAGDGSGPMSNELNGSALAHVL